MSPSAAELAGRVAIVTGGAGGIGQAIARALGSAGAQLLLVGRTQTKLDQAVTGLARHGIDARACAVDLTTAGAAATIVDEAMRCFGRVDVLVNSAALFVWKPFLDQTEAELAATVETNLAAPMRLTQAVARRMVAQGAGGVIVNLASIHGEVGDGRVVPHVASKFGLIGFTRAAAEALRSHDIRVNAVAPGSVEPGSSERHGAGPRAKATQADVASMVLYLCGANARSISGAVFDVHGVTRLGVVER